MQVGNNICYLHADHLGSTSVVVPHNPNLAQSFGFVSRQTYYPFGVVRTSEVASPTDYGYTGQRLDASDALMYSGARYYDPSLGRFISADTFIQADAKNPSRSCRRIYANK